MARSVMTCVSAQSAPAVFGGSMACLFYPPVTGGKSAISSPSLILVSNRAIS